MSRLPAVVRARAAAAGVAALVAAAALAGCGRAAASPAPSPGSRPGLAKFVLGPDVWRVGDPSGDALSILGSEDGGRSWTPARVPLDGLQVTGADLAFSDAAHGWALLLTPAPDSSPVLRTTDGGRNWTRIARLRVDEPTAMGFRTPRQGWILAAAGDGVEVYRTSDAGTHWTRSVAQLPRVPGVAVSAIGAPAFTGAQHGSFSVHLGSSRLVYRTADGGATWAGVISQGTVPMARVARGQDVWEADYPLGHKLPLRRSTDGGRTWKTVTVTLPAMLGAAAVHHFTFVNAEDGWLLLGSNPATAQRFWVLLHTTDGGAAWRVEAQTGASADFPGMAYSPTAMAFRNADQGWIVAVDPWQAPAIAVNVYRTNDGGVHWRVATVTLPKQEDFAVETVGAPVFTNARDGSFVLERESGELRFVTADGGARWRVMS